MKKITGWRVYAEKGNEIIAETFPTLIEAITYYKTIQGKLIKAQFKIV